VNRALEAGRNSRRKKVQIEKRADGGRDAGSEALYSRGFLSTCFPQLKAGQALS